MVLCWGFRDWGPVWVVGVSYRVSSYKCDVGGKLKLANRNSGVVFEKWLGFGLGHGRPDV